MTRSKTLKIYAQLTWKQKGNLMSKKVCVYINPLTARVLVVHF